MERAHIKERWDRNVEKMDEQLSRRETALTANINAADAQIAALSGTNEDVLVFKAKILHRKKQQEARLARITSKHAATNRTFDSLSAEQREKLDTIANMCG